MKLVSYSKKDIKELNGLLLAQYDTMVFDKNDAISLQDDRVLLCNKEPAFFYPDAADGKVARRPIPFLKFILKNDFAKHMKRCVVDMGAVKFVCGGADIMRPGIVEVGGGIVAGDIVLVVDVTHKKPLAVCEALLDSAELAAATSGKVLKNVHYVGDSLWKAY